MAYKKVLQREKHKMFSMSIAFEKVTLKSLVGVTFKIKVTLESYTSIPVMPTLLRKIT